MLNDFDFAAPSRRKSSSRAIKQNLIGGTALAFVVLSCGWVVYSNIFSASVYPSAGFDERFNAAEFASRFDAVYSASSVSNAPHYVAEAARKALSPGATYRIASAEQAIVAREVRAAVAKADTALRDNTIALLDVTHSLGGAPGRFMSDVSDSDQSVASLAPSKQPAAKSQDAARVQLASLTVPMPSRRPQASQSAASGPSSGEIAQAGRATRLATATPPKPPSIFERLFGKSPDTTTPDMTGPELAYAGPDGGIDIKSLSQTGQPMFDRYTAVYDISARTVYLPDGTKLEAHSGLGDMLDNPKFASVRMRGVTPPHVYDLKPRESLFHGVAALRLIPIGGEDAIFGRSGLLAHTYMLGPNGDSNGCVSFKDYNAFLQAYRDQKIKRLAVVSSLNT